MEVDFYIQLLRLETINIFQVTDNHTKNKDKKYNHVKKLVQARPINITI